MSVAAQWLKVTLFLGFARAAGWTLLHFVWQGAAIALLLWCALKILSSPQMRYLAGCIALAAMVITPLVTLAVLVSKAERNAQRTPIFYYSLDMRADAGAGDAAAREEWLKRAELGLNQVAVWLPGVWGLGAGFFLVRLGTGFRVTYRMRHDGADRVAEELIGRLEELKAALGINRVVTLMHSAAVQVPTVMGWIRPSILIPAGCFAGMSCGQVDAILRHELAHIRRHDYAVSVLQSVVEALLFYHPAVWWVSRQIRQERECCCDAMAVDNGGEAVAYARALALLEERRSAVPAFALGADGGDLKIRIRRLLGVERPTPESPLLAAVVLGVVAVSWGLYLARAEQMHQDANRAQGNPNSILISSTAAYSKLGEGAQQTSTVRTTEAKDSSAAPPAEMPLVYKKWMDQDVLWIITPEERAAFKKLTNDQQRDGFIANFWRRRNPPGAAPDSYREAYYARMVYSNEHFASGKRAGWRTDRGHIYLALGKPDEIESYPGGGATGYPDELWHYKFVPGLGKNVVLKFVDTCNCGDYNLSVDSPTSWKQVPQILAPPAASHPEGIVSIPTSVIAGLVEFRKTPVYPAKAKAAGVEGVVVLRAIISKTGSVKSLQVVSGPAVLAASAIDAVRQWHYKPYLLHGIATEVETTININFTLDNGGKEDGTAPATAKADDSIRKIGGDVSSPKLVYSVEPEFTEAARRAKFVGVVLVAMVVNKQGLPEDVHIVRGPGMGLNEKALEAARQYQFAPAMEKGRPVRVSLNLEMNFQVY